MRWYLVAFVHPGEPHSVLYIGDVNDETLLRGIRTAIERGANLMSIRGEPDVS